MPQQRRWCPSEGLQGKGGEPEDGTSLKTELSWSMAGAMLRSARSSSISPLCDSAPTALRGSQKQATQHLNQIIMDPCCSKSEDQDTAGPSPFAQKSCNDSAGSRSTLFFRRHKPNLNDVSVNIGCQTKACGSAYMPG